MKFVGLAGSIGSGKSTVGKLLVERGAELLDVDQISRELQELGGSLYEAIVEQWGDAVLDADRRLDRVALGAIVFNDKAELGKLTFMSAPLNEDELVNRANHHLGTDDVVVAESALYLEKMYGIEGIILVDVEPEVAIERLVKFRGMDLDEARRRQSMQLPRDLRREKADYVLDNSGTHDELLARVDDLWAWIQTTPDATGQIQRPHLKAMEAARAAATAGDEAEDEGGTARP